MNYYFISLDTGYYKNKQEENHAENFNNGK